jgi:hypothetical protein
VRLDNAVHLHDQAAGNSNLNDVPTPGVDSTSISPSWS